VVATAICSLGLATAQDARAQDAPTTAADPSAEPELLRRPGPRVSIFGAPIHVSADTLQDGVVVGIGTDVVVEGEVREDVVVVFGNLELSGRVHRNVVSIISNADIHDARIGEQRVSVIGRLDLDRTDVEGQMVQVGSFDWLPDLPSAYGFLGFLLFWARLAKMLLAFVTIVILATLVPERIRVISDEAPLRYGTAFFVGLLGYLGALVIIVLLTATIVGLPIGILIFLVLKWLGIAGLFHAFGQRMGRSFGREMSLLGSILLVFAPFALVVILPAFLGLAGLLLSMFLGLCIWLFLEVPALGLILLTRGGTRSSEARGGEPAPPVTPQPTVPPEDTAPPAPLPPAGTDVRPT
jgi:hypothetical protein